MMKRARLVRTVRINDAAKLHAILFGFDQIALVGHNADAPPIDSSVSGDQGSSVLFLVFCKASGIHQAIDEISPFIRL